MAAVLENSEDTVPDVLNIPHVPDVPDSTALLSQLPSFSEYRVEGDCPKDQVAAVMLGDADPSWGGGWGGNIPLAGPQEEAGWDGSGPPHLAARESWGAFSGESYGDFKGESCREP